MELLASLPTPLQQRGLQSSEVEVGVASITPTQIGLKALLSKYWETAKLDFRAKLAPFWDFFGLLPYNPSSPSKERGLQSWLQVMLQQT